MEIESPRGEPLAAVAAWLDEARRAGEEMPEAMAVASANPAGEPSLRMVLLRGLGPDGFVFYTDRSSRKGRELAANPHAAVLLHWRTPHHRQVRASGPIEWTSDAESDAYWRTRPIESRRSAIASHQSSVIASRAELEARRAGLEARSEEELSRPERWGGYRLRPVEIEFWEERPHRLHERLRYRLVEGSWSAELLSP